MGIDSHSHTYTTSNKPQKKNISITNISLLITLLTRIEHTQMIKKPKVIKTNQTKLKFSDTRISQF